MTFGERQAFDSITKTWAAAEARMGERPRRHHDMAAPPRVEAPAVWGATALVDIAPSPVVMHQPRARLLTWSRVARYGGLIAVAVYLLVLAWG